MQNPVNSKTPETPEQYPICSLARKLVKEATIRRGGHDLTPPTDLTKPCPECVMELRAHIQLLCKWPGARWTDSNPFDSPAIRAFMIGMNDYLDDEPRQLLKPLALLDLRTGTPEVERKRSYMLQDWATRVAAASAMKAIGLTEWEKKLKAIPAITDADTSRGAAAEAAEAAEAARAARAAWAARAARAAWAARAARAAWAAWAAWAAEAAEAAGPARAAEAAEAEREKIALAKSAVKLVKALAEVKS